jgi:gamma-glutamyl hercynylcysteine S-oxide synthase
LAKAGVTSMSLGLFFVLTRRAYRLILPLQDAKAMRQANAVLLADGLTDARHRTLRLFDAMSAALQHQLHIRFGEELNPPLWELGHVGWFEERWIARNPQRLRGIDAQPETPLAESVLRGSDRLYDSSHVAHAKRWHLDLPDVQRTQDYLRRVRERTLALLEAGPADDGSLYFFRLALLHEDMHHEASLMIAQALGLAVPHPSTTACAPLQALNVPAHNLNVGHAEGGFAFDNELGAHTVAVPAFEIDSAAITWGRYLPFIEAGGYQEPRYWSEEGWSWRRKQLPQGLPRYIARNEDGALQQAWFGQWQRLDPDAPAMHLSAYEALAWCRWAHRRLPSEHEWMAAAQQPGFEWGQVWEWTSSPFAPYPGFTPHPYRDYSQPWFDGRPVLKGGSWATALRMKHTAYRNYFNAGRNDVFAGFRSCAA